MHAKHQSALKRFGLGIARPGLTLVVLALFWPLIFFMRRRFKAIEVLRSLSAQLEGAASARLDVGDESVTVHFDESPPLVLSRSRITQGWIAPGPDGKHAAVVCLRGGGQLLLRATRVGQAREILRALGISPEHQRAQMPFASRAVETGNWDTVTAWMYGYFVLPTAASGIAHSWVEVGKELAQRDLSGILVQFVLALIASLLCFWMLRWYVCSLLRGTITIGSEGFKLTRYKKHRFVSFADVKGIAVRRLTEPRTRNGKTDVKAPHTVVVDLGDGNSVDIPTGRLAAEEPELLEALRLRLTEAWEDYRNRPPERTQVTAQLSRQGRSASAWRDALQGLSAEWGYRRAGLTAQALLDIAEDPSADPEHRVGATVALSETDLPAEDRSRLRIAAERCARPALRIALDAAQDGTLDQAQLEAIEAETEAERQTPLP